LHHVEDTEPPPLSTPVVAPAAAPAAAPAPQAAKPAAAASVVLPKAQEPARQPETPPAAADRRATVDLTATPRFDGSAARTLDALTARQAAANDLSSQMFDAPAPPPAGRKKMWLAGVAVAVIAVAGVSLPAARKLIAPGSRTSEGTLVVSTSP